jgi:ketosteroid isomerase-like protein
VVILGYYHGTARGTGKAFGSSWAHVWTLAGGQVTNFQEFTDTHAAAEAFRR